jgi:hypothetical protein
MPIDNNSQSQQNKSSFGKLFATDVSVEKEGIWVNYGVNANGDPLEIRIGRAGGANKAFAMRHEALTKPYRRLIQAEQMDKEVSEQLMQQLYAETVVKDWRGVLDADGNEIPFSVDNVREQFRLYPDLFADVVENSTKVALYREELREADSKN